MKKCIILFALFLTACSSTDSVTSRSNGMIMRALSYIPMTTKRHLNDSGPEDVKNVVRDGLAKFPLEDLYRINQLKIKMADSSLANCRAMAMNSVFGSYEKEVAFSSLSDAEFDEYARLVAKTFSLGTNYDIKAAPKASLSEVDRIIQKALKTGLDAPGMLGGDDYDQLCWKFQKISRYADGPRTEETDKLIRHLVDI